MPRRAVSGSGFLANQSKTRMDFKDFTKAQPIANKIAEINLEIEKWTNYTAISSIGLTVKVNGQNVTQSAKVLPQLSKQIREEYLESLKIELTELTNKLSKI